MSVPNKFQPPPPCSHSSRLTPVSTNRENHHMPSKSSMNRSLDLPHIDSRIGLMSSLFLYVFRSNCKGSHRFELRNSWNSGIPGTQEFLELRNSWKSGILEKQEAPSELSNYR
jgi:hypothetical protein